MNKFGICLKKYRKKNNLTQQNLTDKLLKGQSEYFSKQSAKKYIEKIQALPRETRESPYKVTDEFSVLAGNIQE